MSSPSPSQSFILCAERHQSYSQIVPTVVARITFQPPSPFPTLVRKEKSLSTIPPPTDRCPRGQESPQGQQAVSRAAAASIVSQIRDSCPQGSRFLSRNGFLYVTEEISRSQLRSHATDVPIAWPHSQPSIWVPNRLPTASLLSSLSLILTSLQLLLTHQI